ncbi:MAG TPA: glutamine-hydrolyzing carbamoyl-phosphate synthase small subunit [Planctomycetota bacterium]|nr:glutamine-hydrolyzing carbamoyl-phosphate synthase small subunit [Planctomycetota bacterium]
MKAILALEDGAVYAGESFGAEGEKQGEVVFNTAMSGYQEILTDPSYKGQIVLMTAPQIGNYGVNLEDVESDRVWVEGFVAREFSRVSSNWRATATLQEYLRDNDVVAIDGIDTRAITKKLRVTGALNGVLSTTDLDPRSLVEKAKRVPKMDGLNLVPYVTRKEPAHWSKLVKPENGAPAARFKVGLIDCGVKFNIVRRLVAGGCDVTVFPSGVSAKELDRFQGVVVSNGPGDPREVKDAIATVRELIERGRPVFGICLGHQIIGCAVGARVHKLKFGHHGANHPVKNVRTGLVEITSQNHGFAVDGESAEARGFEVTHVNLNDGTCEGMRHKTRPVLCVQYHPEASPGPHDSRYLFDEFCKAMAEAR